MKTIDLSKPLKNLSGKLIKDEFQKDMTAQVYFGNLLMMAEPKGDAIRQKKTAEIIYFTTNAKKIELEDADYNTLKQVVTESRLSTLLRSYMDQVFLETEERAKKKEEKK